MTDGEVLYWVEEHVAEIRMVPTDPFDGNQFTVVWIDEDGYQQNARCNSLRELVERHS